MTTQRPPKWHPLDRRLCSRACCCCHLDSVFHSLLRRSLMRPTFSTSKASYFFFLSSLSVCYWLINMKKKEIRFFPPSPSTHWAECLFFCHTHFAASRKWIEIFSRFFLRAETRFSTFLLYIAPKKIETDNYFSRNQLKSGIFTAHFPHFSQHTISIKYQKRVSLCARCCLPRLNASTREIKSSWKVFIQLKMILHPSPRKITINYDFSSTENKKEMRKRQNFRVD